MKTGFVITPFDFIKITTATIFFTINHIIGAFIVNHVT
jgi:hypothetical protein